MRTKPPTAPGSERRNSTPPMPASRALDDTRMPEAPPPQRKVVASSFSTLAKALPSRITTPAKPPSRTIMFEPSPSPITGTAETRSARTAARSSTSAGSHSHSAAPPLLNQTSGGSGAGGEKTPQTQRKEKGKKRDFYF